MDDRAIFSSAESKTSGHKRPLGRGLSTLRARQMRSMSWRPSVTVESSRKTSSLQGSASSWDCEVFT
jgi:hypothetical protein